MAAIVERELTGSELDRVQAGFIAHGREHGIAPGLRTRHTFVLTVGDAFAGCASGLRDNEWYYLSDLWVEDRHRRRGFGARMLQLWEARVASEGIRNVYTWTAGFQVPAFYERQGYSVFVELPEFYSSGHGRIGLRKSLP